MNINNPLAALAAAALLGSCATPKIAYFQDMRPGVTETAPDPQSVIRIRPEDKISILVNSKDPLLTDLFNLPYVSRQIGGTQSALAHGISGYTVDQNGCIDFPVLGELRVEGKPGGEIAALVKGELVRNNLVNDPVVTVEFMNLSVSVLGEVARPGRFDIDKDRLTLLEAIGMAGDLTVYGQRDNVLVQREENGKRTLYKVNLNSGQDLYASPAYYLRQNDVVYVAPNSMRARQATVNGNNIRSSSFWISLASLLTTVLVLIID